MKDVMCRNAVLSGASKQTSARTPFCIYIHKAFPSRLQKVLEFPGEAHSVVGEREPAFLPFFLRTS